MNARNVAAVLACVGVAFASQAVNAGDKQQASTLPNKYKITAEEQSACGQDAVQLCSSSYPDEDAMLGCMKIHRVSLSASCRPVFDDGMRRRHLN